MAELAEIVKRLEAATLKLETIASQSGKSTGDSSSTNGHAGGSSAASVTAFQDLIQGPLQVFVDGGRQVGGLVKDQVELVHEAFITQKGLIEKATQSKKPDATSLPEFVKPLQTLIQKIVEIKDKNRPSPLFNHLSCVAEGIPALGWIVVEPTPGPFVGEMKDSSTFYANRVIKEYKDKEKAHCDFVGHFTSLLIDLQAYVKKYHTTGLVWNPKGGDWKSATATATAKPTPAPVPTPAAAAPTGALMSALNSTNLTAGLRKVDKSEMTHKNPELRASSLVKANDTPAPATKSFTAPKAPPKFALEGNKWVVENQVNNTTLVIDKTELRHVVYIYNCTNSTVQIKGKVNAVTVDNCKKTGILLENAVSTVDVVNSKSCQLQVTGKVPTVVVDKTDGFQLYLSRDCMNIELLSAKSSEMNVIFEDPTKPAGSGDFIEKPVSEQFKTTIVNGNLVTVCVEHKG